ncbi:MAG: hypothetical protein ACQESE_05220 [Nanobdellota archaeon]
MGIEQKISKTSDPLLRHSRLVDNLDCFLGPIAAACYLSGSEYLQTAGTILSTVELIGLKLPFVARYLSETKDYKSLIFWLPKEIISNSYPMADVIDIAPVYYSRTKYKVNH